MSVILPTYNYARFLAESVASVQKQDVEEIEILIVDDGSTDETPEIVEGLATADPRIRYIPIPRSGLSAARNVGLDEARAEYIAFHDADDRWRAGKLRRQVALLDSEPDVGLCFTDFARFHEGGFLERSQFDFLPELRTVESRPATSGLGRVITGDAFVELIQTRVLASCPPTTLLRRAHVGHVRCHERLQRGTDYHYYYNIYRLTSVAFIPEPLVEVRRHGGNMSASFEEMFAPYLQAISLLLEDPEPPLAPAHREALRRRLGRAVCGVGYEHFWSGRPVRAGRAYFRALAWPGSRVNALKHLVALPVVPFLKGRREEKEFI
ncbi:MAG: glycosyltransferase family 2 protein [Gemmatimonadota bacterium]|nr:glycosyltransferase family 2 protein [Gemmatimonadota bacterium]